MLHPDHITEGSAFAKAKLGLRQANNIETTWFCWGALGIHVQMQGAQQKHYMADWARILLHCLRKMRHGNVGSIAELSFRRFFFRDECAEMANVLTVVSCSTLHDDLTGALQNISNFEWVATWEFCKPLFFEDYAICLQWQGLKGELWKTLVPSLVLTAVLCISLLFECWS